MTDIIYEDEFPQYLDDIANIGHTVDYTSELSAWHLRMSQEDQENFDTEGHGRWSDWRIREVGVNDDHAILNVTGKLQGSLVPGGDENHNKIGPQDSEWGTLVDYAANHNFGFPTVSVVPMVGRGGRPHIPVGTVINIEKRPFATMTLRMIEALGGTIAHRLIEKLKG
jgi:phage gpG-like protein